MINKILRWVVTIVFVAFLAPYGNAQCQQDTTCEVNPLPINFNDFLTQLSKTTEFSVLREARITCDIKLKILVDEEGKYLKHRFLESCHPWAKKAIEENIRILNFQPGISKDIPQECWTKIQFKTTIVN